MDTDGTRAVDMRDGTGRDGTERNGTGGEGTGEERGVVSGAGMKDAGAACERERECDVMRCYSRFANVYSGASNNLALVLCQEQQ